MSTLQDWVYNVEAGPIRLWLVRIALFLILAGLAAWIGIREFNGLRTAETMDLAQQARQLSTGQGFTTKFIRPLALWQLRSKMGNDAPPVSAFPETLSAPLYPIILGACFKVGQMASLVKFNLSADDVKGFRIYPADYLVLGLNVLFLLGASFSVYGWAARQFDIGTGVLAVVFFLGSASVWDQAVGGGLSLCIIFIYALSAYLLFRGCQQGEDQEEGGGGGGGGVWVGLAGLVMGLAPLVQMIQIWPVLAFFCFGLYFLKQGRGWLLLGVGVGVTLFLVWMGRLWGLTGNPLGLNWAYFLSDSPNYPGDLVWRTYTFDMDKTDVWRRVGGSVLRGLTSLVSQGPALCGSAVAGTLALVAMMHGFRKSSASQGRNLWGVTLLALLLATSFIYRGNESKGSPLLLVSLPVACVYGSAYLWIIIERWKLQVDLLGKIFAILVALLACWPTLSRLALPEPGPFNYPPTYPPIFLYIRSWFESGELQASDLPAAEAWYTDQPTLWIPSTREDFLKIHDRVTPVFSILFTPASSDVKMYSQMMAENSEWSAWVDLIRRQKPPDLPQAFATSLPPNNDYLLLSIQKRWK
jgi:hypothetical protein